MTSKKIFAYYYFPISLFSANLFAHGYAEFPPARQLICHDDGGYWSTQGKDIPNAACKAAYDKSGTYPFVQINEYAALVKDYRNMFKVQQAVKDDLLCSAGSEQKAGMSIPSSDWQTTQIKGDDDGYLHFLWKATAPHNPSFFQFYITKPGHDFSMPLKWQHLDKLLETGDVAIGPDRKYRIKVPIPQGRNDRAILFSRWQRVDPAGEGFYNCSDITFSVNGSSGKDTGGSPAIENDFYNHGYFISQGFPTPNIGDYLSFRGFRDTKGEVIEERLYIDATTQGTWPKDMADLINSRHATKWAIGVKNAQGDFSFDNTNWHANRVWSIDENDSFVLSIIPKPDIPDSEDSEEETVDQGNWDPNKAYVAGDKVIYSENEWIAQWWNKGVKPGSTGNHGVWRADNPSLEPSIKEWKPSAIYTEGDKVSHLGKKWRAFWWTQGDEPGTTGKWGVWREIE